MSNKKAKTPLSQIYTLACKRLKLKRREKIIFFRLLGFLYRNDKPFPYSIKSLSENTGYSESPIYESLNVLETLRLIERIGFTNQVKFIKGSILKRICTLVRNRSKLDLIKSSTLVRIPEEFTPTSPDSGYIRTSLSLELKKRGLTQIQIQQLAWYLKHPNMPIKEEDRFLFEEGHANIIQ